MSIFENFSNSADKGTDASKEFVSKSYEYTKLKAFQLTTLSIAMFAKLLVIGGLVSLGFIFVAFSGAIALGEYLDNMALGYLCVGLCIIIFSLLLLAFRKSFDRKVVSKMSKKFFN
ncbi:hypothetical protein H9W90_00245 [Polaribacter pectinis]|uniref:Competence protein n=1 Tax=Polaribacter pectinis TaxID=2738844 RepID=A0A7G9LAD9_9FLAO|nr:hypothetical protein [Polaribacter pectinis]QNM85588.1 hypothetical protein H9W90_00245 [Polaribacter pectinis]